MIKIQRQGEYEWTVWNTKTQKCADIIKFTDYGVYVLKRTKYRVDVGGITIDSLIENFQTAKKIAYEAVRKA